MIELYGNKIWNSNTPNKYKKVIIASEDSLDNICQELENSGLNYCAYIFNGEAHIAIGRATANKNHRKNQNQLMKKYLNYILMNRNFRHLHRL